LNQPPQPPPLQLGGRIERRGGTGKNRARRRHDDHRAERTEHGKACLVALRAATPRTVLPPAATASRSAAATSNAALGAPPESRAERTAAGRPNRIASRGVAAAEAVGCFVAACVG